MNIAWIVLIAYVLFLLFIDFFILHRKEEAPGFRKAIFETIFFVANGLLFSLVVYYFYNNDFINNPTGLTPVKTIYRYLTGYLVELSLSVDNLFVIAVIFSSFKIPGQYQHRLLFLGILGAIVFRAILISVGLVLIEKVHAMTIVFGIFLLYSAFRMLKNEAEEKEAHQPSWLQKIFRFSKELDGKKLVTKKDGKRVLTALAGALITIEFTDLLFALDSIPAIFAVTTDPFIVYSSNIFAILGLRSLYFFLANMLDRFHYLKYSVFAILVFVAIKLMATGFVEIPEWFSLMFIGVSLGIGILVSLEFGDPHKNEKK
jgi:tellurite resistance protein TerC